jgi:hypothetical protein
MLLLQAESLEHFYLVDPKQKWQECYVELHTNRYAHDVEDDVKNFTAHELLPVNEFCARYDEPTVQAIK